MIDWLVDHLEKCDNTNCSNLPRVDGRLGLYLGLPSTVNSLKNASNDSSLLLLMRFLLTLS
jgi:hypothetical protein